MSLADSTAPYQISLPDLTDVIFDMDESQCRRLLLLIASDAQTDAIFADHRGSGFAVKTWKRFDPAIRAWAKARTRSEAP